MPDQFKRIRAEFYRTDSGNEPVREWLKDLSPEDRRTIGITIKDVEYGWPIGMPICRPLGSGLWEIRNSLSGGRISRVLFCIHEGKMILLHGFIKKTQKTPTQDLELSRKRQQEFEL